MSGTFSNLFHIEINTIKNGTLINDKDSKFFKNLCNILNTGSNGLNISVSFKEILFIGFKSSGIFKRD
eukprot:CAMPEP_0197356924 /NCGR_PEP_ID=MMETSP0893-20130614/50681_1 /TAXON_ID=44058 ORGANISM="Aureoumbra lagunensis, Strain CCMP1510" /NCGR_SAMPLE_ID=MMETSP0893 /ASSEMBLY_ACC=CAM_ASM_000539 /LENGTH=67 /DNA_ID=CAMNT_0042875067 /DNA_START=151 /DNA_END=354 /DNA_ORIENTATION=-